MNNIDLNGFDEFEDGDDFADEARESSGWAKGVHDPNSDSRVNIWSLNGFGEPVLTGGMYQPDETKKLEQTVKDYCAAKSVTPDQLCAQIHNKVIRNAWQEIAQCLPHRTVLSVYRRALRQFHGMTRGTWEKDEVATLFRLVELYGPKWKTIQDKLGRSATDCRVKYEYESDQFKRGKWSVENVELLLKNVRSALRKLPRKDMDVREINQWTLEHNKKIPWTAISYRVNRRRQDCYFKWKQMTKRSNNKAIQLGLEPTPMARETHKFDVRQEYYRWKAEQDPKWRQKYTEEFVLPLLQKQSDGNNTDNRKEQDLKFLDAIIESRPTRPSEVSWQSLTQGGEAPRERWDDLIDTYAPDDDLDLPLWKLATVVKSAVCRNAKNVPASKPATAKNKLHEAGQKKKKSNIKKQSVKPTSSDESDSDDEPDIAGVSRQQIRNAIKEIVDTGDTDNLTIKGVRKLLQKQLSIDLSAHKDIVKKMVKEML